MIWERLVLAVRDARLAVADAVTPLCLRVVSALNTYKDSDLSARLYDLADDYNPAYGSERVVTIACCGDCPCADLQCQLQYALDPVPGKDLALLVKDAAAFPQDCPLRASAVVLRLVERERSLVAK